MIHRPNRYVSNCYFCKQNVGYMQGWLRQKVATTPIEGNFIVVCKECFAEHRKELHTKNTVSMIGEWDIDKSQRKHLFRKVKK